MTIPRVSTDGRFAPSPSGPLHLGSLRTALAAWLFARAQGSRFLLRIEDLDPQRSRQKYEREHMDDLRALGLDWDGPVTRQSERTAHYGQAIARLEQLDLVYPCFCTRAEIRDAASAPHGDLPEGAYPGTCFRLTGRERDERLAAGRPHALRIRAGGKPIAFEDLIQGQVRGRVDDFVVRRSDGVPAYQLAVVVDDAAQGIGQVVRGADLATSTPRQIWLGHLLGLPTPSYAHVPLVLGPDGKRLAKRHGPMRRADRDDSPSATLTLLAHSLGLAGHRDRVDHPRELLNEFNADALPREPVTL